MLRNKVIDHERIVGVRATPMEIVAVYEVTGDQIVPVGFPRINDNTRESSVKFEQFIETAWTEHGDRPQEVADRLAVVLPMITAGEHVAPFARIVTHVYGEHLGQCDRGVALLESVRRLPPTRTRPPSAA